MMHKIRHKIVVGVTGASGAIYAKLLIDRLVALSEQVEDCAVIFSDNSKQVWKYELENEDYLKIPFRIYEKDDFFAPFASGSGSYDAMVICPCTMGTLGRIASGIAGNLMTRTADVMLKERKKLILVVRETPYNAIHIDNMKAVTEAGGIIYPASPAFYSYPKDIKELVNTFVEKIIKLMGFDLETFSWQKK